MKDIIENNLDSLLIYNDRQIERIREKKECDICDILLQFVDDYKMIIQILLEEKENKKDVDNIIKSYKKYKDE